MDHWRVPSSIETFIKVDVESVECKLLPSWIPWISSLDEANRPTFFVAFHSQIVSCSDEEYRQIVLFAKLFRYATLVSGGGSGGDNSKCIENDQWSCKTGDVVFSYY